MRKFIFLLLFIPLGCSVESNAVQDKPAIVKDEAAIVRKTSNKDCAIEPLLETYENFIELGIKSANLTTETANISFSKRKTPEVEIRNNLTTDFGKDFLKNACALRGSVISLKDTREGYLGAYQITYNSEESAVLAADLLEKLNTRQLKFFKVATVFDWTLDNNVILIYYNSPALTMYYEQNVSEFSK